MELRGVAALVTGGAHRVGRAISLALAGAGCDVVLHHNTSAEAAAATAEEIRAMGCEARLAQADLTDPDSIREIFVAGSDLGPVRVLVNSAGIFPEDSLESVTGQGWDATFAINVKAPAFLTQALAEALPAGESGAVVNVTDWRTVRPYPNHFSYTVAKAALDGFTMAAAVALAPRIRVNGVALGAMLPPPGRDADYLKQLAQDIPLDRTGGTEPVQQAVLHLLDNDFVTGEIVRLDGGAHLV